MKHFIDPSILRGLKSWWRQFTHTRPAYAPGDPVMITLTTPQFERVVKAWNHNPPVSRVSSFTPEPFLAARIQCITYSRQEDPHTLYDVYIPLRQNTFIVKDVPLWQLSIPKGWVESDILNRLERQRDTSEPIHRRAHIPSLSGPPPPVCPTCNGWGKLK